MQRVARSAGREPGLLVAREDTQPATFADRPTPGQRAAEEVQEPRPRGRRGTRCRQAGAGLTRGPLARRHPTWVAAAMAIRVALTTAPQRGRAVTSMSNSVTWLLRALWPHMGNGGSTYGGGDAGRGLRPGIHRPPGRRRRRLGRATPGRAGVIPTRGAPACRFWRPTPG